VGLKPGFRNLLVLSIVFGSQLLTAAPKLRLSQTTVGPVPVATNGTGTASVDASNAGDGNLNLQLTSSVTWLVPTAGTPRECAAFLTCTPINIDIRPGTLAAGLYTGVITISDPNAVDAPQTVTVTVSVGGTVPQRADFYLPTTGGSQTISFNGIAPLQTSVTTQNNVQWLAVNAESFGSFRFGVTIPFRMTASTSGLGEGTYNGQITVAGSTIAGENRAVPVTMRITSSPIADLSAERLDFRGAPNGPKLVQNLVLSNRGSGNLTVSGVTATTSTGGSWLTAERVANTNIVTVTANATGLAAGTYDGSLAVASNAVQGAITVPVRLQVIAAGAPVLSYGGVINNGVGDSDYLGQGTIAALFGEQILSGDPVAATSLPLGTDLGGVKVFVNDTPAPVYYASYGQVNFQVPYNAPTGDVTIRVERGGTASNRISTRVVRGAPRLLRLGIGDYGIVVNQDGSFPIVPIAGLNSRRARPGDTLVMYAIGVGPTNPAVASGVGSPASPLARGVGNFRVTFGFAGPFGGNSVEVTPFFVGLTPNFVGLYQINVTIPAETPRGDNVAVALSGDDGVSNRVTIAIE